MTKALEEDYPVYVHCLPSGIADALGYQLKSGTLTRKKMKSFGVNM